MKPLPAFSPRRQRGVTLIMVLLLLSVMLLGGLAFGVIGDKKGRLQILFGSITLYSLATIANGFVTDLGTYRALRFVAGVGLARRRKA